MNDQGHLLNENHARSFFLPLPILFVMYLWAVSLNPSLHGYVVWICLYDACLFFVPLLTNQPCFFVVRLYENKYVLFSTELRLPLTNNDTSAAGCALSSLFSSRLFFSISLFCFHILVFSLSSNATWLW